MQISTLADLADATESTPDALTLAELNKLEAAGIELTQPEKRLQTRLAEEADSAALAADRRQQLADIEAAKQEARELRERKRTVHSSAAPTAPDDHLVLGLASSFYTHSGYPLSEWELDSGHLFVFRDHALLHFVPRAIALEVIAKHGQHVLPGTSWPRVPRDLLRALENTGQFTEHRGNQVATGMNAQGNLEIVVPNDGTDWEAVLRMAGAAVRGCDSVPMLRTWLESAEQGEGEHYVAFAAKLRARIEELGGDDEELNELEDTDDAEADDVDEEDLASETEEVDAAEESPAGEAV